MRLSSRLSDKDKNHGEVESFIDFEKYTFVKEEATDEIAYISAGDFIEIQIGTINLPFYSTICADSNSFVSPKKLHCLIINEKMISIDCQLKCTDYDIGNPKCQKCNPFIQAWFLVEVDDIFANAPNVKVIRQLTAELAAREKQYEYYRNRLLNFGDNVEWKTLGNIGRVAMCKRILKSQTTSTGDVPFYKIGTFGKKADAFISKELFLEYKEKYSYPKKGSILISAAGTIGRTVIYDGKPAYYQDSNIVWLEHDETVVLNKYLLYCYQLKPWSVSYGGTISRLYNDDIQKAKIPVPSLSEQQRIVDILDCLSVKTY